MKNFLKAGFEIRFLLLVMTTFIHVGMSAQDVERPRYDTITVKIQEDTIVRVRPAGSTRNAIEVRSNVRRVPDSVAKDFRNDPDFAYANDPAFWKKEPPPEDSAIIRFIDYLSRSAFMRWLLYLFLAAVVIFAIYQVMVVNDFFVFSRGKKKNAEGGITEDDIASTNIDELLHNAIREGNYRLATRLFYLKTLKYLSGEQLIQLNAKSTNQDYVKQMRQHTDSGEFSKLTRIYEYVWYGEYTMNNEQFEYVRKQFDQFIKA